MKSILLFALHCAVPLLIIFSTKALYDCVLLKSKSYRVYVGKQKCADLLMNKKNHYLPVLKKEAQSQYTIHSITKNVSEHIAFDTIEKECGTVKEAQIFIGDGRYYNVYFESYKDMMDFMMEVLRK
jgi:hypothetical protein